jgi:hypothetical protein
MNKPHKHAELIHKWADGFEIEFKDEADGKWKRPPGVPQWNEATEYRIKPEPQYPKTNISDQQIMAIWNSFPALANMAGVILVMMNKAIARAIEDGQVIIAPGQIEG